MTRVLRLFTKAAPFQLILVLMALAWAATYIPDYVTSPIRLFNQWVIISMLAWMAVKFGAEARLYREELGRHREEIVAIMKHREDDLMVLRQNAEKLARETARLAEGLAQDVKDSAETNDQQLRDLRVKIEEGTKHAQSAYHEANSVNLKIDEQQKALVELNKELLVERKTHEIDGEALKEIRTVTVESHEILKNGVVKIDSKVDSKQIDNIERTGEDTNALLRKRKP